MQDGAAGADVLSYRAQEFGNLSDNKDGKRYSVDICEPCCDRLAEEFVIAPEIEENIELI